MKSRVRVIVLNWNGRELLRRCLRTLAGVPEASEFAVCVVDNASTDGSIDGLRRDYPDVQLVANSENLGFAAGNNVALRHVETDYVALLNTDAFVRPGALRAMADYLDAHPSVGMVGPRLLNPDGSPQESCWADYPCLAWLLVHAFYLWRVFPHLGVVRRFEIQLSAVDRPTPVAHLLGACLMVRAAAVRTVGLLDEAYWLYFEETDWCRRMREAGWDVVYLPHAEVEHLGQQSSMRGAPGRCVTEYYRSLCRFLRKWGRYPVATLGAAKPLIAVAAMVRLGLWVARWLTRRHPSGRDPRRMVAAYAGAVARAIWL